MAITFPSGRLTTKRPISRSERRRSSFVIASAARRPEAPPKFLFLNLDSLVDGMIAQIPKKDKGAPLGFSWRIAFNIKMFRYSCAGSTPAASTNLLIKHINKLTYLSNLVFGRSDHERLLGCFLLPAPANKPSRADPSCLVRLGMQRP